MLSVPGGNNKVSTRCPLLDVRFKRDMSCEGPIFGVFVHNLFAVEAGKINREFGERLFLGTDSLRHGGNNVFVKPRDSILVTFLAIRITRNHGNSRLT